MHLQVNFLLSHGDFDCLAALRQYVKGFLYFISTSMLDAYANQLAAQLHILSICGWYISSHQALITYLVRPVNACCPSRQQLQSMHQHPGSYPKLSAVHLTPPVYSCNEAASTQACMCMLRMPWNLKHSQWVPTAPPEYHNRMVFRQFAKPSQSQ